MKQFAEYLNKTNKKRFLDVCSGVGNFAHWVASIYDGYEEMIGVDTSEKAIAMAKQKSPNDRITFAVADVYDLPYDDASFDVVSLQYSLHHLADSEAALKEMARVLKDDGFIVVNEMLKEPLDNAQVSHKLVHHFAAKIDRLNGDPHGETYSKQDIINLLQPLCELELKELWELDFGDMPEVSDAQIEQILGILDQLLTRIPDDVDKTPYEAEAQSIKDYIKQHRYAPATNVLAILTKSEC